MTNGANFKRGKLHHSPWHSEIHTSNQLNIQMNTFVLLPLQESMVQRSTGKHDQWQGYMTILVVNYGIIKSISILTAVILPDDEI
jgi:riboflavin transporter FmnP